MVSRLRDFFNMDSQISRRSGDNVSPEFLFVLMEKVLPLVDSGGRLVGLLMIAAGIILAFAGT